MPYPGKGARLLAWSPSEIVAIGEFHGVNIGHRVRRQKTFCQLSVVRCPLRKKHGAETVAVIRY
jgi:hypothetical protein